MHNCIIDTEHRVSLVSGRQDARNAKWTLISILMSHLTKLPILALHSPPVHTREAGEVYTKKIGSVYRSVYCTYICILPCYTTLSSINTSRLYTLLQHLYTLLDYIHFSNTSICVLFCFFVLWSNLLAI